MGKRKRATLVWYLIVRICEKGKKKKPSFLRRRRRVDMCRKTRRHGEKLVSSTRSIDRKRQSVTCSTHFRIPPHLTFAIIHLTISSLTCRPLFSTWKFSRSKKKTVKDDEVEDEPKQWSSSIVDLSTSPCWIENSIDSIDAQDSVVIKFSW